MKSATIVSNGDETQTGCEWFQISNERKKRGWGFGGRQLENMINVESKVAVVITAIMMPRKGEAAPIRQPKRRHLSSSVVEPPQDSRINRF